MQPRPDEGEPNPERLYFSQHLPYDAEQMGLDRNTEEGAMIAMAVPLALRGHSIDWWRGSSCWR